MDTRRRCVLESTATHEESYDIDMNQMSTALFGYSLLILVHGY